MIEQPTMVHGHETTCDYFKLALKYTYKLYLRGF